jgi:hypothetical protein
MVAIPGTVNWYIGRLGHSEERIRLDAIKKLGEKGDKRAVEPLSTLIGRLGPDLAEALEMALSELGATREQIVTCLH